VVEVITTIWIKDHDKETWRKFVELAKREGRSASELIMNYVRDYVERHSKNPAVPLDTWVTNPGYTLFPTLGEPPDYKKLREFPRSKLAELRDNAKSYYEMADQLTKWLAQHEREHIPLGLKMRYCPYCEG
jgi:crotonobetainyl-CoA:carnitine CoA-transferase CaiB-like acyl-CoA transferase